MLEFESIYAYDIYAHNVYSTIYANSILYAH